MVFSSIFFICVFLPIMIIGYYILPYKARNIWLLIGSLVFYTFGGPRHLLYLLLSIVINYCLGLLIASNSDKLHKADERGNNTYHSNSQKVILFVAIVINIVSLIYFKYVGMIFETIRDLSNPDLIIPEIIMPLGISFYTFQSISYLVDVYRKEGAVLEDGTVTEFVARNPINFALYIAMFPQVLQGPIIRYNDTRPALENPKVTIESFAKGIERFIIGLSKKALIANTLGEVADKIFAGDPAYMSVSVAWLGAILYTLQIYFDFSGYSDMAIGLGKLFGFNFCENFNYPYISKSVTEFWRRWHISLSNWFRDYLYIPLGGNRRGNVYFNLLIVFLATGIWHGAAWGFLVWGLWHGLFMLLERYFKGRGNKNSTQSGLKACLINVMSWAYTMLAVTLGWVLFKLEDLNEALKYIASMFNVKGHSYNAFSVKFFLDKRLVFFMIIAFVACIPWAQILPRHISAYIADFTSSEKNSYRIVRYCMLGILFIISMIFVVNNTYSPFIYFQF